MHSYAADTAVFRLELQLIELQGDGYDDAGGGGAAGPEGARLRQRVDELRLESREYLWQSWGYDTRVLRSELQLNALLGDGG